MSSWTGTKIWKPYVAIVAIVALGAVVMSLVAHTIRSSVFEEDYRLFGSIRPGMTVEEVVGRLGPPHWRYSAESAPEDYYVPGHAYRRRPITKMVFIYSGTEPVAYVYFDHDDRVEYVFIGGS